MRMQDGYHLELVASEPDVVCPVICAWDGNGRMYVAEMRTYMPDINGSNEKHADQPGLALGVDQGDGVYDKHTVFADHLVLPRMVLPLDDRDPDPRDRHQGHLRLPRHQGHRRGRREDAGLQGRHAGREPRAPAVGADVEHRQLDLYHRRLDPLPLHRRQDGDRAPPRRTAGSGAWRWTTPAG